MLKKIICISLVVVLKVNWMFGIRLVQGKWSNLIMWRAL